MKKTFLQLLDILSCQFLQTGQVDLGILLPLENKGLAKRNDIAFFFHLFLLKTQGRKMRPLFLSHQLGYLFQIVHAVEIINKVVLVNLYHFDAVNVHPQVFQFDGHFCLGGISV